jgi:hypothetical protein
MVCGLALDQASQLDRRVHYSRYVLQALARERLGALQALPGLVEQPLRDFPVLAGPVLALLLGHFSHARREGSRTLLFQLRQR